MTTVRSRTVEDSRPTPDISRAASPHADVDVCGTAALDVPLGSASRPSWRGRIHLIALVCAVPMLVVLAIAASGARARAGVIVYGIGLCSMLGVSTTYHRWVHTISARAAWRRADHATIFAAIAGTSTAVVLTSLPKFFAITMLVFVWSVAAAGAALKVISFERANRAGAVMYIGLGWSGLVLVPAVWQHSGVVATGLLLGGGLLYTVGAAGFRRQWPTLRPSTFSYHEIWHSFTVAAAGLHFAAVYTLAT